jgi:hypothetical protein
MSLENWEYAAPAQLQFWPAHVNPSGPAAWDSPTAFATLREAIAAAAASPAAPPATVAWILTSGGKMLTPADIEGLWLDMQAPAAQAPENAEA